MTPHEHQLALLTMKGIHVLCCNSNQFALKWSPSSECVAAVSCYLNGQASTHTATNTALLTEPAESDTAQVSLQKLDSF